MAEQAKTPIYHITHVDNLRSIIQHECLWSDSQRIRQKIDNTNIGHSHIKERRLRRAVPTASKGFLGDYVPFNFCHRSVMLYVIFRNSVQGYDGGQEPIVHLVSTIESVIDAGRSWTFTDRHADVAYARYFEDLSHLAEVNWDAMTKRYWTEVREIRQAEFLVHDCFPWTCVKKVAVHNAAIAKRATEAIAKAKYRPPIAVEPGWYY